MGGGYFTFWSGNAVDLPRLGKRSNRVSYGSKLIIDGRSRRRQDLELFAVTSYLVLRS